MEQSASLLGTLLIVGLMGGVGIGASVGEVLALRRSSDTRHPHVRWRWHRVGSSLCPVCPRRAVPGCSVGDMT